MDAASTRDGAKDDPSPSEPESTSRDEETDPRDDRSARSASPVLRMRRIERRFELPAGDVFALRGIDLEVAAGEYVAICGTSGSGKSTLLQIIGLLDRPTDGKYWLDGRLVSDIPDREQTRLRNESIGFVFQSFQLLGDRSALENVRLPLEYRRSSVPPHDPRELLARVGLADRATHRPGQLSGGEKQRVAIARALVKRPRLILLDEPTGNLDSKTGQEILALIDELQAEEHASLLLVTHDPAVAERASRTMYLRDGQWTDSANA